MPGAVFPHKGKIFKETVKIFFIGTIKKETKLEFTCGKCFSKMQAEFVEDDYPRIECVHCKTMNVMPYFLDDTKDNTVLIETNMNFTMES